MFSNIFQTPLFLILIFRKHCFKTKKIEYLFGFNMVLMHISNFNINRFSLKTSFLGENLRSSSDVCYGEYEKRW